jgi:hypothetical protein
MIDNARNRAALILYMARCVFTEEKKLTSGSGSKLSNQDYLISSEPIFKQFLEHKEEIFLYLKNL